MRTKRKYTKLCALLFMFAMLLTACSAKNTDNNATPKTTNEDSSVENTESTTTETTVTESATEPAEDVNIEDWGARYETVLLTGEGEGVFYSVRYPSLVPAHITDIAFQMDPTLAMVGNGGPEYRAKNVEDVLPACMDHIIEYLDDYREVYYDNFVFDIEDTQSVTINNFPACKYTGTHSFTVHDKEYEVPFAAYALDLKEKTEAYMYIIVIDESVLNTERPAVEDGVIEDYAYKMALSVEILD